MINELQKIITEHLNKISHLYNEVDKSELEKHNQLKEFSKGIIEIIDSLENIEEGLIEKGFNEIEETKKIMSRYQSIRKKLYYLLAKYGVTKIDFPDNRLIVGLCEVVDTIDDPSKENDAIISVLRNGYIRGNELIRSAQIVIVKN